VDNRELDALVAEKVMGWERRNVAHRSGTSLYGFTKAVTSAWVGQDGQPVCALDEWEPTTDIRDDYEVLVKVRETWGKEEREQVFKYAQAEWANRFGWRIPPWMGQEVMAYLPGDWSRAALKALGIDVD
jgi:hypothetical protein